MNITRNAVREAALLAQIKASFGDNVRDGIHLSDLLNPRRAYWGRVLPLAPSNSDVLYWTAGRGHEDVLGRIAGLQATPQRFWNGISFRPDWELPSLVVEGELDPTEFKTRRSNLPDPGDEEVVFDSYLDQLRGYCAVRFQRRGNLVVLSLLEGRGNDPLKPTEPVLAFYEVEFTEEELERERANLEDRRNQFEAVVVAASIEALAAAVGGRQPALDPALHKALPLCKAWMCGKPRKIVDAKPKCLTCDATKGGREFETQWGIEKHQAGKSGAGHQVVNEQSHFEFEPRCKYYVFCRPQDTDKSRGQWT